MIWCVLATWWTGTKVFALRWLHSCLVSFDRVSLWACGSQKGTQHDDPGCVCVVCAWPRGVDVDRRRTCPHSRDVGAWYTDRCQWWCDPLGDNCSCEPVCVNRGRRTHLGYPRWSGRVGWMRVRSFGIPWWVCVVAVMGRCDRWFGTSWRHPIDT